MRTRDLAAGVRGPQPAPSRRAARQLQAGTIVLVRGSRAGTTYACALAERIEAFTLERLESLAMQPARLVLGAQLARQWDLRSGQTIDAKRGIYDGHSAADRARTMRVAASGAPSSALSSPGKVVIETAINDASRLCLEFATSGGRRPALAVAALCTDDGRYVTADEVARDRRLSHLALGVASADISPVAANGSVGNGDGQARGHDCQSLTQGATVGGQHRC